VPVKPLAHIVANYACCDRHKEVDENDQNIHLLSVARLEKGSTAIVTDFAKYRKDGLSKQREGTPKGEVT
jgi:hypothetical protein